MFSVHRASTNADWREATALLHDYAAWALDRTGLDPLDEEPHLRTELTSLADLYATDDAVLYLATWEATAVGAVSIRVKPDRSAELKRMYVRPIARGRGVVDWLIGAAIAAAIERHCHTVWLETVRGAMDRAIAVYRRNGFAASTSRQPKLGTPLAIVMERALVPRLADGIDAAACAANRRRV
jgi:putative acetyltransferase